MSAAAHVNIECTPVFWANKEAYDKGIYRVIGNQGSTRSSKTYSLCQLIADIASNKNYGKKEISIVSPSLPHLKKGALKDFLHAVESLQLFNENDYNRSDHVYTFPQTGSYVEFFGVENALKVRGPGRDILYCNEWNLIPQSAYTQLALRTKETIFGDFNPADEYSYVYNIVDNPKNKLIISNYRNNLANIPDWQREEIEALQLADENLWKVFGLGQRGTSTELIYTHWRPIASLPGKGEIFYGCDFGYNVPTALTRIEAWEGANYAQQVIYQTKLTTPDLIELFKIHNIGRRAEIYCDNAEPKTIEEIQRAGFNAIAADKDVTAGIRTVKSKPLYITNDSTDGQKEMRSYKWKMIKDPVNGELIRSDEPVKFNDHFCDSIRYGIYTKFMSPNTWNIG